MTVLNPNAFGPDLSALLRALGLTDATGFRGDWLTHPDRYLAGILANPDQRQALLDFVAAMRGGTTERDSDGRHWVPLFEDAIDGAPGARIAILAVLDESPTDHVRLSVGFRFTTAAPLAESASTLTLPLFRAAKQGGTAPPNPLLLGQPGGIVTLSADVALADADPPPGEAGLRRVGLRLSVPTHASDGAPGVGLSLSGLQLPGETTSRDLSLSLIDPDAVRDAGLDLVLSLVQAQIGGAPGAQVRALARMLGIGADPAIPAFPFADLAERGLDAMADWLAATLGAGPARAAWLGALAQLIANGAAPGPNGVTIPIGGAQLRLRILAEAGVSGRPVITLGIGFALTDPVATLAVEADLLRLDLGATGDAAARAVPRLSAEARFDLSGAVMPNVSVAEAIIGLALDQDRRPLLVLALRHAVVFGTSHPLLDLTNPDAMAAAASGAAAGALTEALTALGPAGTVVAVALGWARPTGASAAYPLIDLIAFLGDPLGQLAAHWRAVLTLHAGDLPHVLASLARLFDATPGAAITGTGSEVTPWQIPLVTGVHIALWRDAAGRLLIGLGIRRSIDTIGQHGTIVETRLRIALVALDLNAPAAAFLPQISLSVLGRGRSGGRLTGEIGLLRFRADHLELAFRWTPEGGLRPVLGVPGLALTVENVPIPLDLPAMWGDGATIHDLLTMTQWDAIEQLTDLAARRSGARWLQDAVGALGWRRSPPGFGRAPPHRLRLGDLVTAPEAALRSWLGRLLSDPDARIEYHLQPLARLLSGDPLADFAVDGSGTFADPWRVELVAGSGLPAIAVWREPGEPLPYPKDELTRALRRWRPGMPGVEPGLLALAWLSEMPHLTGPFGAALTEDEVLDGLTALAAGWAGSDGAVLPPATLPPDAVLHLVEDTARADLLTGFDATAYLGAAPAALVTIRVLPVGQPLPAGLSLARVLDLRDPARDPLAFTPLPAAAGPAHVFLAPRADAGGIAGQVARLRHGLSLMAGQAGTVVLADPAAGHAAWLALDAMGPGLDTLMLIGTPLAPTQLAPVPDLTAAEVLRRLDEVCPTPDPADPDDADLALGRALLADELRADPAALAIPPGWTGNRRATLALHLIHGVLDSSTVKRGLTAILAAGLSLNAQARDVRRELQRIDSASLGGWLPFGNDPAAGDLAIEGHILGEALGVDIDHSGTLPMPRARTARRIAGVIELRRRGGWLIGGPGSAGAGAGPVPDLALRSARFDLRLSVGGGPQPALDRVVVTLYGVRVGNQSWPRVVLSPALVDAALLGIDGQAPPSMPELRQMLTEVMAEMTADAAADPALARILDLLRGFGVIGAGGGFDAMSLSNWLDDPAARLSEALARPDLRVQIMRSLSAILGDVAGVDFDPDLRRVTLTASGATGLPLPDRWALSVTAGLGGVSDGSFRLGDPAGTHLAVTLAPFGVRLNLGPDEAAALGGLPPSLPIWPNPAVPQIAGAALPAMIAAALSRILDAARGADPTAAAIIDAIGAVFGVMHPDPASSVPGAQMLRLPARLFIDPAGWLRSAAVLGGGGAGAGAGPSIAATRLIAAMDALRPVVGLAGSSGVWDLAPGLALRARASGGGGPAATVGVIELVIDASAFAPAGAVVFGGAFGLRLGSGAAGGAAVQLSVGLRGAAPGRNALHLALDGGALSLLLRPAAGADIAILPNPGNLMQLATAGIVAALPAALDAIVATGSPAGRVIGDVGDALLLRQGGAFDAAELSDWATDPLVKLQARWTALLGSGLSRLAPALPVAVAITTPGGSLRIAVADAPTAGSTLFVQLFPAPFAVALGATVNGIPFLSTASAALRFDGTGLARLESTLGPAAIPLGDTITLRPVFSIDVGAAAPDRFVAIGLDIPGADALRLIYDFDVQRFDFGFGTDTPEEIAAGIMHLAIDLLGGFVTALPAVQEVLAIEVKTGHSIGDLLDGVVLRPAGGLDPEFFRVIPLGTETPLQLLESKIGRVFRLIDNLAAINPAITIDGKVTIGIGRNGTDIALSLALADRFAVVDGDIRLWIENDSQWIIGGPPAGILIGIGRLGSGATPSFTPRPSIAVNGVGLRIGRGSAPLVDAPVAIGSIALHGFVSAGLGIPLLGGANLQIAEIAVPVGGGSGDNAVAGGMLSETSGGDAPLAPAFSPSISVQTRPTPPHSIAFGFRAGDGEGPWWLPIRRAFGPLYVDQLGLGTQIEGDQLKSISILFDGGVSIAGLQAQVDDLSLTHHFAPDKDFFDPARWSVDLKGLAVSADMSGVMLAGGLRKFGDGANVEYIGMLMARVATYGLSIYGGYAAVTTPVPFTSFFAYGAIVGPFGGPPAFFLTGIGGGFGINRDIVPPSDMSQFNSFPMLAALDPSYTPRPNLMDEMAAVRASFPVRQGQFWFAGGISFTSFALVDGVAVIAISFGQGFELSLFGLARVALPRPQVALVSIELGLMARFSTEEGVIWVQAQLTENSWLLHRSARLTGGFAFVSWFKGPLKGQFVLTLGGYHPNFHRDGYPNVPRLGLNWQPISNIVIKAEVYFALTSEAIMAGGLFEASAKFGPAYAHLSFGGNAIVYFDPFSYEADAHAVVTAGVRIETWLGDIDLSFSVGAWVEVRGPEFGGKARVEFGPISETVRFGSQTPPQPALLSWRAFTEKYLELSPTGRARALAAIVGRGALPPAAKNGAEPGTADGSPEHPFEVVPEFDLSLTSTVPFDVLSLETSAANWPAAMPLGIGPAGRLLNESRLTLRLRRDGFPAARPLTGPGVQLDNPRIGAFPIGVWGPAPDPDVRKLPKGDVIHAREGVDLRFRAVPGNRIPAPATGGVSINQVEPNPRKPLPLRAAGTIRTRLVAEARRQRDMLAAMDQARMDVYAAEWLAARASVTETRSYRRSGPVPMRVGLLAERIVASQKAGRLEVDRLDPSPELQLEFGRFDLRGVIAVARRPVHPMDGLMMTSVATVKLAEKAPRVAPPQIQVMQASRRLGSGAVLIRSAAEAPMIGKTLVAAGRVPVTTARIAGTSAAPGRAGGLLRAELLGIDAMLAGQASAGRRRRIAPAARGGDRATATSAAAARPRPLALGEIAVIDLPGRRVSPRFETSGTLTLTGRSRIVGIGFDGRVALDVLSDGGDLKLPPRMSALAIMAGARPVPVAPGLTGGWVAGTPVAYLGMSLARCKGGFIIAEGASRARAGAQAGIGWMDAGLLTDQSMLVETRLDRGARCIAFLLAGAVTEDDLAALTLSFDGDEQSDAPPLLVPVDGATLIVMQMQQARPGAPVTVRVGGQLPGQLDGVFAADLPADRLVSMFVNGTLDFDLSAEFADPAAARDTGAGGADGNGRGATAGVTAVWTAPAPLPARSDEDG